MELFTDMYVRDKNSKQVIIEAITTGSGEFYFKDDDQNTDIGKYFDKIYDIV